MSVFDMHPRELARYREQSNRPSINSGWICSNCMKQISGITGRKRAPIGSGWFCPECAAKLQEGK